MSSSYRLELDRWLSQLEVTANKVVDIGGSQLPVKGRTKSWDVQQYLIADLAEPHVNSPSPNIELDLNLDHYKLDGEFDIVFCLEVFDYVWNPVNAFEVLASIVREGGIIYATFPFAYPTHQPIEDDALRYTEGGIRKLADYCGLEIVEIIKRRPETDALDRFYRAERMRFAKHYDHEFTGFIVEMTR